MPRVWLITGSSSGFGREIALAATNIGDTVVATSRDENKLKGLEQQRPGQIVLHQLDVTGSDETVQAQVASILGIVGRIDVLVNNAGYILEGAVEECS
jgi:NADP-dependent 3-hydroxy acid dehydrogenase YdfG